MCLILFAYKVHPDYPLLVAANRDEFYGRPTKAAHFWDDHPNLLAGRDLEKMGTWMGVTADGRFAALTNYRDPLEKIEGKHSRGELVASFLTESSEPEAFLKEAARNREQYPGYNLLVGSGKELFYYSNMENKITRLHPGIYGLSNHLLNTAWPKVELGKQGLREIIEKEQDKLPDKLLELLRHADPAPDESLPQTGVSLEWERILSSLFIQTEGYGTRSSTVLLMGQKEFHFIEHLYGEKESTRQFRVEIQ